MIVLRRKREIFELRAQCLQRAGSHDITMQNLLKRADVAQYLGVSIMTVKRREAAGLLNPIHVGNGRIIRFRKEELDALLESNAVKRKGVANASA